MGAGRDHWPGRRGTKLKSDHSSELPLIPVYFLASTQPPVRLHMIRHTHTGLCKLNTVFPSQTAMESGQIWPGSPAGSNQDELSDSVRPPSAPKVTQQSETHQQPYVSECVWVCVCVMNNRLEWQKMFLQVKASADTHAHTRARALSCQSAWVAQLQ